MPQQKMCKPVIDALPLDLIDFTLFTPLGGNLMSSDTLGTRRTLKVGDKIYNYYSLPAAYEAGLGDCARLPFSLKVLLENLLRHEDGDTVTPKDFHAIVQWLQDKTSQHEIAYRPARVLMQDFTGVPAVVDLAAMRDAMKALGGDPEKINPLTPVDLVIDHSVQVDEFGTNVAFHDNVHIEMQRNHERYGFLRWGQQALDNFRVVPPGTGICHQVNLEYLAKAVWTKEEGGQITAYPDTLVGTDSHTTMINGLGVLGWGVGGIEAEAAMLGQPVTMLIPEVVGMKLTGNLREGITATDLVLTVTEILRAKGVVGKFVEFYGNGLAHLPLANRATISNMAPEYGATCGFFPIDEQTIDYMRLTGRDEETLALVEAYAKAQNMWHFADTPDPVFTDTIELDLSTVQPSLAGPKRPQDRVTLAGLPKAFDQALSEASREVPTDKPSVLSSDHPLVDGAVVIAAITSCTNTSNPSVLMAAGLVAKKALEKGLQRKPWVKSSLAPGSKVVTDYLVAAGLQEHLDALGFNLVGYGCTTCIGNSGPLEEWVEKTILEKNLLVSAVLSGNRNFEGRIHPYIKANWLASPPLVVAFALAGTTRINLESEPLGYDPAGNPVFLRDIWPSNAEVAHEVAKIENTMFSKEYADVFAGDQEWQAIPVVPGANYKWEADSTYVQHPPFFQNLSAKPDPVKDIKGARVLALFGDSVTTDHISPAGAIKEDSPAGQYLKSHGVTPRNFNSYGSRRGNHEVMMRGTFANIRIRNEMVPGVEGGFTRFLPTDEIMPIYDAAMRYQAEGTPLVVVAGKEYGTGSSRDWAAKGPALQGVRAVITESFERIHRSNLIGMGILPLQFKPGVTRKSLHLDGSEHFDIVNLANLKPGGDVSITITRVGGQQETIDLQCRIDTQNELEYFRHGGILVYVLRNLL
ncbi:MAG: aconitate hydratase [Gammaproteobacteria bacterium]|jgi:aconitate hydratase|nr:aconitate hydratase [Gammaproteobacteria bacterium]